MTDGEHEADARVVADLLRAARDEVVRHRLDLLPSERGAVDEARVLGSRSARRARRAPAAGSLPVSFAAPRIVVSDRGVDEVGVDRSLRRAADAPRVEKARREEEVEVARRGRVAEAEDVQPFGEERPLLRIERLELAEVDDGRIDLDLAEVGIDRAGEREARGQRRTSDRRRRRALVVGALQQRVVR